MNLLRNSVAVDIALRLAGLIALALAAIVAERMHLALAGTLPRPTDFLIGLCGFGLLSTGISLLLEGAALFRPQPRPPRPLLS